MVFPFQRLKRLGQDDGHLRVSVEGGGCSGFQYKFEMDTEILDNDKYLHKPMMPPPVALSLHSV